MFKSKVVDSHLLDHLLVKFDDKLQQYNDIHVKNLTVKADKNIKNKNKQDLKIADIIDILY